MEIKGYWHIIAGTDGGQEGCFPKSIVIKARSIKRAIKKFYTKDNNFYLFHNYRVISIKPLSVKVLEENEKEN